MSRLQYRVNIIADHADSILGRAARELLPAGFTIGAEDSGAQIEYYLPYLKFKRKNKAVQVGYFTHLEENPGGCRALESKISRFKTNKCVMDACIAISEETRKLIGEDCPVIRMGSQFKKPIIFGVCGRVHKSGRKNEGFVRRMVEDGFGVISFGDGWGCPSYSSDLKHLESFYKHIDYLVVTSKVEGGPVPVLEAISLGVSVIAPNVGWCWDFPVIRYERNNYDSLYGVLRGLTSVPTWDNWRQDHVSFFNKVGARFLA